MGISWDKIITVFALMGGVASANAQSAPTDYFSESMASAPLNELLDPCCVTPQPGVSTGQIAGPETAITNPVTAYWVDSSGPNINGIGALWATGYSTAAADRATGQLHAGAGATWLNMTGGSKAFGASSEALFGDTLRFTAPGAGPTTQTTIGFSVHVDGTLTWLPGYYAGDGSGDPSGTLQVATGPGSFAPGANCSIGYGFCPYSSPNVGEGGITAEWGAPEGTTSLVIDQTYYGSFSFYGSVASVPIFVELSAGGGDGLANFTDTATFSFDTLPDGVSYTSASGDFLSGAAASVPEPSIWTMLLLGFAGLGFAGYRASRKAAAAA